MTIQSSAFRRMSYSPSNGMKPNGPGAASQLDAGQRLAAAREARFRELVAHAARGQHGHGRQRAEAAQRRAQRDAQHYAGELREGGGAPGMRAPPQGHVAEAGHAQR